MINNSTMNKVLNNELRKLKNKDDRKKTYEYKQKQRDAEKVAGWNELIYGKVDTEKYRTKPSLKLQEHHSDYLDACIKHFFDGMVNEYKLRGYIELTGYTVSCLEDIKLGGVTPMQMRFYAKNAFCIKYLTKELDKAGICYVIKAGEGRLVILASSDKETLTRAAKQFQFLECIHYKF